MTTSLPTRVKRITLNQWRYYYNKLLLVDVPLNADFMEGLLPSVEKGNVSDDAIAIEIDYARPSGSDELAAHELIRNELAKYEFVRQRLDCDLNQMAVPNIYSSILSDNDLNRGYVTAVKGATNRAGYAMRSLVDVSGGVAAGSSDSLIIFFNNLVVSEAADLKVPGPLAQVSSLLSSLL